MRLLRTAPRTASLIFLLVAVHPAPAAVIRVPADQPTIQAGIDAAVDGDVVLVAPGIYEGDGNREMTFDGKAITVRSENGPNDCVIHCGLDWGYRAFRFTSAEGPGSLLEGFTITKGGMSEPGGAVLVEGASPTIRNNLFHENWSMESGPGELEGGGAIACLGGASPLVTGNRFTRNGTGPGIAAGGAILAKDSTPIILNNIFSQCRSDGPGGAITVYGGYVVIRNCTIEGCGAEYGGGGIWVGTGEALISDCILWNNWWTASLNQIRLGGVGAPEEPVVTIHHSCIERGEDEVAVDDGTLNWGQGNIDTDPLFTPGPSGSHYLSQVAAGQTEESPCVDTGDPESDQVGGTTRTDNRPDTGTVDMGGHYLDPDLGPRLVTGPGPAEENPPLVSVFLPVQDATPISQFVAYGADAWGVNVSCGRIADLENDSIITGAGPGEIFGPHVRGWHSDGTPLPGVSFIAYGTNKFGVNVAAGDLDGDGYDEIITGAGQGAVFGPHVRAWDVDGGTAEAMPGISYFAYGTLKFGVNVAAGDLDGDGYDEIVTGAGPGAVFGPHVRGWNVDGGTAAAMPGVSFLAYGTLKYGVNVACGDVDGDGIDEILTAPGPSVAFSSNIRGWNVDGGTATPLPGCSFIAWSPTLPRFGAHIASGRDLDGDNRHEIVVGAGPDPSIGSPIRIFEYRDGVVTQNFWLEAYPSGWTHGVNVAAGIFE